MGKMGRILGQESYVETARVAIGLGMERFGCMVVLWYDCQGDYHQQRDEETFWDLKSKMDIRWYTV